jgi:hypothetical protein
MKTTEDRHVAVTTQIPKHRKRKERKKEKKKETLPLQPPTAGNFNLVNSQLSQAAARP